MNELVCYEPGFDFGDWLTIAAIVWLLLMAGWNAHGAWLNWQAGSRIRDELRRRG